MEKDRVTTAFKLAVLGGSAGSLEVVMSVVSKLRNDISFPIIIVMHRKQSNDNLLAELLAGKTTLSVKEAEEKDQLRNGTIYLAPADYHLLIEKDGTLSLDASEKLHFSRPGIDATFESAADVYGASLLCILLSGANADGVDGLNAVLQNGGTAVVQDPATALVPYMPQQAITRLGIKQVLSVAGIADLLNH